MSHGVRAGKRLASMGLPLVAFAVLSALAVFIFEGIGELATLRSRNDSERTMNVLLSSLREHENFGAAIESVETLRDKVIGVAAYAGDGSRLYAWGDAPEALPSPLPANDRDGQARPLYLDVPERDAVALVFHAFRGGPPPPDRVGGDDKNLPPSGFFFTTLRHADFMYLEIRSPEYWGSRRTASLLLPLVELLLAALVLFIRGILIRNAGYRQRIDEQRNLVVLGTAASTLAHEIKNPLLSIRLQTRILQKILPGQADRELGIIDDEVGRLESLSHRVGDYLRDPAGQPAAVDPTDMARGVGVRLCGRDIVSQESVQGARVPVDPERLRSVLENLVRNALESGDSTDVGIQLSADESFVRIDVLDRGAGLAPEAALRAFDPFFTTKSRGTGIGLAVCKRFVTAAGGDIALEPRQGGGCVATVTLPRLAVSE